MQIILNEQPMDIQLEEENSLGEVITGVEKWLAQEGYVINTLEKDTNTLDLNSPDSWSSIAINEVKTLKIDALLAEHARINHLETLALYFQDLKSYIEEGNHEGTKELLGSIQGVVGSFQNLMHPSFIQTAPVSLLLQHLRTWESTASQKSAKADPGLLQVLEIMISLTVIQLKELADPDQELGKTTKVLKEMLPGLIDLSLLLQTNKDKEALNLVITLTEVLNKTMRLIPIVGKLHSVEINEQNLNGTAVPDFFEELNSMLGELSQAFESSDSVLIGDLTEYEIVPRLENLILFIEKL